MLHQAIKASVLGSIFLLVGCGGGGDDDAASGGAGGTGGGGPATCGTTVTATQANNYTFFSDLEIDVTPVKPSTVINFDWSGVHTDFLGHPVNLATVGMVEIGLWNKSLDEFEQGLNDDTLAQSDLAIIATIIPNPAGATTGNILDLTEMGEDVEDSIIMGYLDINAYPPANHIYTAMVADGMDYGKGTRMIQGFQLDASSANTQVNVTDESTHLDMMANLHSLQIPGVPAGNAAITIDWTTMTLTAAGLPFNPQAITQMRIGKYDLSPTDMEAKENFLNLDTKAITMYSTKVKSGTSIELSKALDPNGMPFTGIDDTHTWLLALNCAECANPAPWYMTVLKPCTP